VDLRTTSGFVSAPAQVRSRPKIAERLTDRPLPVGIVLASERGGLLVLELGWRKMSTVARMIMSYSLSILTASKMIVFS
jgi:hypothetical protein